MSFIGGATKEFGKGFYSFLFNPLKEGLKAVKDITKTAFGKISGKKMKQATGFFKNLGGFLLGPLGGLISFLSNLGVLSPIITVLNALIEYFGAQLMMALMPVITELIEILLDPVVLSTISLLAKLIGVALLPVLIILTTAFKLLIEVVQPLLPHIENLSEWLGTLTDAVGAVFNLPVGEWFGNFGKMLVNLFKGIGDFITKTIDRFKGHGKKVAEGKREWWDVTGLGKEWKWYQHGTTRVPETGPAIVHQGEEIRSANQVSSAGTININISGNVYNKSILEEVINELEFRKSLGLI